MGECARTATTSNRDRCHASGRMAMVSRAPSVPLSDKGGNIAKPLSQPGFHGNDDLEERLRGAEPVKDLETIDVD